MTNYELSWGFILFSFLSGIVLSCVYCTLLWYSIKKLPNVKHKGLFLFLTSIFRLVIFVSVATFFGMKHPAYLLCMIITFAMTRFLIVKKKAVARC